MGDMTKNFSRAEFACPCCGADNISTYVVNALQRIRDTIDKPLVITSGIRCMAHNAKIGGVKGSAHVPADLHDGEGLVGHAVDIKCVDAVTRYKLLKVATKFFVRIGIGASFIHLDNDTAKPQTVAWDYYDKSHKA